MVCVIAIQTCKSAGVISYRDFNSDEAKKCESTAVGPAQPGPARLTLTRPRVPHLRPFDRDDLHQHQSLAISLDPRLHHLQESDDHLDRVR